jgi:hypothetical protein
MNLKEGQEQSVSLRMRGVEIRRGNLKWGKDMSYISIRMSIHSKALYIKLRLTTPITKWQLLVRVLNAGSICTELFDSRVTDDRYWGASIVIHLSLLCDIQPVLLILKKRIRLMLSPCCTCVCVTSSPTFEYLNQSLWNLMCITWHMSPSPRRTS